MTRAHACRIGSVDKNTTGVGLSIGHVLYLRRDANIGLGLDPRCLNVPIEVKSAEPRKMALIETFADASVRPEPERIEPSYAEIRLELGDFGYSYLALRKDVFATDGQSLCDAFADYQGKVQQLYHVLWSSMRNKEYAAVPICKTLVAIDQGYREAVKQAAKEHVELAIVEKAGMKEGDLTLAESYSDQIIFLDAPEDDERVALPLEKLAGGSLTKGDYYNSTLAWSIGYDASLFVAESSEEPLEGINLCIAVCGRGMIAWAVVDDIARSMKLLAMSSAAKNLDHATADKTLQFWRKFAAIASMQITPGQVANWRTTVQLYEHIWKEWRIESLYDTSTRGSEETVQLITDEVIEERSRTEKRINLAALLISAAVIIGLGADLVNYAFSDEPPQRTVRFYWLMLSVCAAIGIIAWVLFAGKRRRQASRKVV